MNAETLFFSEISKLKRCVTVKAVQRILLNAALTFLGICIIVFIIEKAGFLKSGAYGWWYILLIGFSLCVGLLTAFLREKGFLAFLIDIDTRLKLKDKLSTAYEYQKFGKKSDLSNLLMEDATDTLRQLSTRKLFPPKFSFLHLVLILLILINMALYSSNFFLSGNKSTRSNQYKLEKITTLLQNYSENRIEGQKEKKKRQPDVYTRELENLSNKLKDVSMTQDQLFTTLNRFLKDVRGKQTRLANGLDTQLTAAKIEEMPDLKIPTLQNLSASNLKKLKMLLNQLPNNQIPDSVNRDIETLQELHRLEMLLSQIIDDINEDTFRKDKLAESDRNQTRGSQYMNDLKKARDDTQHSRTLGKFSNQKPDIEDPNQQPGSDQSRGAGRDLQKEFESRDGYSFLAGRAKSTGKKKSSTEIEKPSGPGIQDKMISAQMQNYLIHIRSLTAIGESRIEAEDIMRTYRQEIEGILQKEDIPLNYREYIKHYFISIGLKTEKNAHEFK
jgi:hypothetical protein